VFVDVEFPYKEEKSDIFKTVKRPRIKLKVFSQTEKEWVLIDEVLADTGADFSVLPRYIGEMLVKDITKGKYIEIKGVVPGVRLIAYIHNLKIRINEKEFEAPVALADSDDVPMIFGRIKGLDLFDANFLKGEKLRLKD
jgi:hypothetical protein